MPGRDRTFDTNAANTTPAAPAASFGDVVRSLRTAENDLHLGGAEQRALAGRQVVAVAARRRGIAGEGEERLSVAAIAAEADSSTDAG